MPSLSGQRFTKPTRPAEFSFEISVAPKGARAAGRVSWTEVRPALLTSSNVPPTTARAPSCSRT